MSFGEAAWKVLREAGKPLHYRELTDRAIDAGLVDTHGRTPARTMNAQLSTAIGSGDSRFVRVDRGIYGLSQWQSQTDEELLEPSPIELEQEYLTYKEAAQQVLADAGKPLRYEGITRRAIDVAWKPEPIHLLGATIQDIGDAVIEGQVRLDDKGPGLDTGSSPRDGATRDTSHESAPHCQWFGRMPPVLAIRASRASPDLRASPDRPQPALVGTPLYNRLRSIVLDVSTRASATLRPIRLLARHDQASSCLATSARERHTG